MLDITEPAWTVDSSEEIAPTTGTASPQPRLARIGAPAIVQDLQEDMALEAT